MRLFILIILLGCSKQVVEPIDIGVQTVFKVPVATSAPGTIRILFVGNSLTYTNNLPALVAEIGKMDNSNVSVTSISLPNYSLEDHWNEGKVQQEISKNKYDIVIGQQGPSALPESQVLLKDYAKRFADLCRKESTPFALYMVWPSAARSFDLGNVIYSYSQAATAAGALLCPAGLAWKNAWQSEPALGLYGPDQFHPSVTGTALAAMTIYAAINGKDSLGFIRWEDASWHGEVSDAQLSILKNAALKAIK